MQLSHRPVVRRTIIKTALVDAVVIVILLAAAELALRAFGPAWSTAPSTENETFGHPVRYNSFGFRGPEFPVSKPPGEFRVLVFGNSVTFGTGIGEENIFTTQLQNLIDRLAPDRETRIINAAGQGGGIPVFQKYWAEYGERISADLVIIAFTSPMIAQTAKVKKENPKNSGDARDRLRALPFELHKLLFNFYVYTTFDSLLRKNLFRLGILKEDLSRKGSYGYPYAFDTPFVDIDEIEELYRIFDLRLGQAADAVRNTGSRLLVVNVPTRFTLSSDRRDNIRNYPLKKIRIRPDDRVRRITQRQGIRFLDLQAAFTQARDAMLSGNRPYRALYIPNDANHLDEFGHRMVASHLAREIMTWVAPSSKEPVRSR